MTDALTWPELFAGTLIKRYKRFLADIELASGIVITAHCPNSGAMTGCSEPGRPVYVSISHSPRRKHAYTWQMIEMPTSLVGINTLVPNRLVAKALRSGRVPGFGGYVDLASEVRISKGCRLDLMLQDPAGGRCYVEVKNATLVTDRVAMFPDAVTVRGLKHLKEMEALVAAGHRCVMFYLVQRMDADFFTVADAVDPEYGTGLRHAVTAGVEMMAYDVRLNLQGISLNRRLDIWL